MRSFVRRDVKEFGKLFGFSLVGIASWPVLRWIGPSWWDDLGTSGGKHAALRVPDFSTLALYAAAGLLTILGVLGVFAAIVGAIRGVVLATCPACRRDVLVGADVEVTCPGCQRVLKVRAG